MYVVKRSDSFNASD